MAMSYEEMKLAYKVIMQAIKNGNSADAEPFDPTPEEYKMLCRISNRLNGDIKTMEHRYGLE